MASFKKIQPEPPAPQYVLTLTEEEAALVKSALGGFNSATAEGHRLAEVYRSIIGVERGYRTRVSAFGAFEIYSREDDHA